MENQERIKQIKLRIKAVLATEEDKDSTSRGTELGVLMSVTDIETLIEYVAKKAITFKRTDILGSYTAREMYHRTEIINEFIL